ncbi:MAG TPA: hypothetical protein PKK94_28665, partial [Leptospiraceae bacterium]|nr:hypothetical protein [Leptospiraceae bacterium]
VQIKSREDSQLRQELSGRDDGTGQKDRKKSDVYGESQKAPFRLLHSSKNIDCVVHRVKCEKRNAQRQNQIQEQRVPLFSVERARMKRIDQIYKRRNKKISIFEISKNTQIHYNAGCYDISPVFFFFRIFSLVQPVQDTSGRIIHYCCESQQKAELPFPGHIKCVRGKKQKNVKKEKTSFFRDKEGNDVPVQKRDDCEENQKNGA